MQKVAVIIDKSRKKGQNGNTYKNGHLITTQENLEYIKKKNKDLEFVIVGYKENKYKSKKRKRLKK